MTTDLKLGLQLGYWTAQPPAGRDLIELAQQVEGLSFDSIWTGESWSSDAFSPLVWAAAHTSRINLATGIAQMSARSPVTMAMHAMTLDALSDGRFRLGIGVSGPQVVEGWYGRPFGQPLARTREYIDILRQVWRREEPVTNAGPHYPLPYDGAGAVGLGKPLKMITHPPRNDIPVYLGAEGPKNVRLATEIADGWIPLYYSPTRPEVYADQLADAPAGSEIAVNVTVTLPRCCSCSPTSRVDHEIGPLPDIVVMPRPPALRRVAPTRHGLPQAGGVPEEEIAHGRRKRSQA